MVAAALFACGCAGASLWANAAQETKRLRTSLAGPRLCHAHTSYTTTELVERRQALRAASRYDEADALKEILTTKRGVTLEDRPDGTTTFRLSTRPKLRPTEDADAAQRQVLRLARAAHLAVDEPARMSRLAAEASALLLGESALHGRVAADAAYTFSLAGVTDDRLMHALADAQGTEFLRWKRPQPLATLQACERLVAAGVPTTHRVFTAAIDSLRRASDDTGGVRAAASVEGLHYTSPRTLCWLLRRATKMRKTRPPPSAASLAALEAVEFADESAPLVVDLGCGFGSCLLALAAHDGSRPLVPTRANLLGVEADTAKLAYARGIAMRWGVAGSAQFAHASAEDSLAFASSCVGGLAGVILSYPTPWRVDGAEGNTQLPSRRNAMVTPRLLQCIARSLSAGGGWLLFQTQVEDVAHEARLMAEAAGLRLEPASAVGMDEMVMEGGAASDESHGSRRRRRVDELGGASGTVATDGAYYWLGANPLRAESASELQVFRSETEAALELEERRVYRFLARAACVDNPV